MTATASALAAESRRLSDLCRSSMAKANEIAHYVDDLPPGLAKMFAEYEDAFYSHANATFDMYVAELARHLPGVAPAIYALWQHVLEGDGGDHGTCCSEEIA